MPKEDEEKDVWEKGEKEDEEEDEAEYPKVGRGWSSSWDKDKEEIEAEGENEDEPTALATKQEEEASFRRSIIQFSISSSSLSAKTGIAGMLKEDEGAEDEERKQDADADSVAGSIFGASAQFGYSMMKLYWARVRMAAFDSRTCFTREIACSPSIGWECCLCLWRRNSAATVQDRPKPLEQLSKKKQKERKREENNKTKLKS